MIPTLKRYSMAMGILLFVIALMMLGTYGVTKFGQNMFAEDNITITPVGEKLNR